MSEEVKPRKRHSPYTDEQRKQMADVQAKERRQRRAKETPEERQHRLDSARQRREDRASEKERKAEERLRKANLRREIKVMECMLKVGISYHHHNRVEDLSEQVKGHIKQMKTDERPNWLVYDPYYWNHNVHKNSYNSRCLLGNLWDRSCGFDTIYDVPLDGTYRFVIYDSGQRGMGSYDYMVAVKVEKKFDAPTVNPGAFPPVNILR
jgi:hypothetical protein